jgi:hypothetical protein
VSVNGGFITRARFVCVYVVVRVCVQSVVCVVMCECVVFCEVEEEGSLREGRRVPF